MNIEITFEELFGNKGIIPLTLYTGVGHVTCPHCRKVVTNINFPPPGIIIVHSCPLCGGLVIPFVRRLVAIDKDRLENDSLVRKHITDCLYNTIAPVLMTLVERLSSPSGIKSFLNNCWQIVYQLVGEKEDSKTFLNKLKKRAVQHQNDPLGSEYETYLDQMSEIFEKVLTRKVAQKVAQKVQKKEASKKDPISQDDVTNIKLDLHDVKNVDDFLKKFGDSAK